jgi:phosphatidate phosphatase LPIN
LEALKREIIHKTPDIFKVSSLKEIQELFPHSNPFFAGFGNRPTVLFIIIFEGCKSL